MHKLRKLIDRLGRSPKTVFGLLALVFVGLFSTSLLAWGPGSRPTFTIEKPATYITFNSITNNPAYGDERKFVVIREAGASPSANTNRITAKPGKKYTLRVYFHNNAAVNRKLTAKNTRLEMQIPSSAKANKPARINALISADNARPKTVWDEVYLTAKEDVKITYVRGSATLHNFGKANGKKLSDNVINAGGALLGYNKLDGKVPGCSEFSGYVLLDVKVDPVAKPNFTVQKQVRKTGDKDWLKTVDTKPGDEVEFLIDYKNTGNTTQTDVLIKDTLPNGLDLVKGSVKLANANTNGKYGTVSDRITDTYGMNIGSYANGATARVALKAKVDVKNECGKNYKLVNKAEAITKDGTKQDKATVNVATDDCPEASYSCDALSVKTLERTKFKFNVAHTVKNATLKSTTYIVRDAEGKELYRGPNDVYSQDKPGKYSVEAQLVVDVDGKDVTVPVGNCKAQFEVQEEPAPDKMKVCELDTKKIINIDKTAFDKSKHTTDFSECDEEEIVPTPIKPDAPKELPQTGAVDTLAGMFGLGLLSTTTVAYAVSRRNL